MSIQRYSVCYDDSNNAWEEKDDDGDFMLYADHAAEVARLEAEVKKYKDRRQHFEDLLNDSIRKETEWLRKALDSEAEVSWLTGRLSRANEGFEKYERLYYLEQQKNEDLTAKRDAAVVRAERAEEALRRILWDNDGAGSFHSGVQEIEKIAEAYFAAAQDAKIGE